MIPYLAFVFLFVAWASGPVFATVRFSGNSGPWNAVAWNPSGPPQQGDTIVIKTEVWDMPSGTYGKVVIWPEGSLTLAPGICRIEQLDNKGELRLLPGGVMKVAGNIINTGVVRDQGSVEMIGDGGIISGGGPISNLVLNAGSASVIRTANGLTLGTLYVAGGILSIDSNDLTVNAEYTSSQPFGGSGILATTGIIALNGPVYGWAQGNLRLGWVTGGGTPKHPVPPATYGTLGGSSHTIIIAGSRTLSYAELIGSVVVDSGAVLTCRGIGSSGVTTVRGTLRNYGTLTAADDGYHWKIEGDLLNYGLVDDCTVMMTGQNVELRTDSGQWGEEAGLKYRASSGGRLNLYGSMTLPSLEISGRTPGDSSVVVNAVSGEILVRHSFASDRLRGCRLLSDTLVRLRGEAQGIILGNVSFEGFYDSKISGVFGGIGRRVMMSMPKRFVGPVSIAGTFLQRPNARLSVESTASVPPGTIFTADVMIDTGGKITTDGDLTVMRGMGGGGTLELTGASPSLDVRSPLRDSLLLSVGRDSVATHLTISRSFALPRMVVHPGSRVTYPSGVSVDVSGEFCYRLAVVPGYSMMSAAVVPADPDPFAVFPGADSVFAFDDILGYVVADSIVPGRGYWVSFPDSAIIEQRGRILNPPLATEVTDGWNIIGGASIPVDTADIVELLTTRISPFFEFMTTNPTDGYGAATTLEPGRGYLVRFGGGGIIVRQ